jgi:5-hydroxyisourate hydrolase-like protein (transthyretin family)
MQIKENIQYQNYVAHVLDVDEIEPQHIMKVDVVQYKQHEWKNAAEPITDVNENDFEMCV